MRRICFILMLVGAVLAGQAGLVFASSGNNGNGGGHTPVTICHATHSESNPYVQITVDDDAVDGNGNNDHNRDGHQDGEDIIPPGPWDSDGRNWDAAGQAIWNNGCNVPATATPTQDVTPTDQATPTQDVTPTNPPPGAKAAYFSVQDPCIGDSPYLMLTMSEGVYVYVKDAETGAVVFETGVDSGFALEPGKTYIVHPTYSSGYWMVDEAGRRDSTIVALTCSAVATQPVTVGGAGPRSSGSSLPFGQLFGGLALVVIGAAGTFRKRR